MISTPKWFWFHDTVSALAYAFADPESQPPFNDLTRFILQQQGQMPDYLRTPMLAATIGFDLAGLLQGGKTFHRQSPEARKRQIAAWKNLGRVLNVT